MIKTDDYIGKFLVNNLSFLKHIHPNFITISGFIVNFIILYFLLKSPISSDTYTLFIIMLLLVYRWLADVLDGEVARKYNKQSKLGGTLDTISDSVLFSIFIFFIICKLKLPYIYFFIYIILLIIFVWYHESLHDHTNLKKDNIVGFFINNSFIPMVIVLFITYILLHKNHKSYKIHKSHKSHKSHINKKTLQS